MPWDPAAGSWPLVFAGGPTATSNPEPFADFFDFFALGECGKRGEASSSSFGGPGLAAQQAPSTSPAWLHHTHARRLPP